MGTIFLFPTITEIPSALRPTKIKSGEIQIVRKNNIKYKIICTGTGKKSANVIENLYPYISSDIIILIGYGGALSPFFKIGDGIVCEYFYAENKEEIQTNPLLIEEIVKFLNENNINTVKGNSYTVNKVLSEIDLKNILAKKGAQVVEMENYWIAKTAIKLGLPFISIRFILDTYYDNLPDLTHTINSDGTISMQETCKHIINNPKDTGSLAKIFLISQYIAPKIKMTCKILSLMGN